MIIEKTNKIDNETKMQNNLIKVIKGSIISILLSLVMLLIFATLLTYTNIKETTIPTVIIVISAISILIGSTMSSMHIKKNGLLNGAAVGAIYILTIYILSSIFIAGFNFSLKAIIMLVVSIIAGMIGGIIGVNKF